MAYKSKYTGAEVDALLDKIAEDNVGDIDSALSTESENPVMNKVVTAKLTEIEEEVNEVAEKIDNINPTPMVSVTYAELVALRDNGELVAGMQYRITDYVTTTVQANTQSAGHAFDVIVTADNENTLNEVARACHHEFDLEKYKDAFSGTWGEHMLYVGIYEYEGKEYHLYESDSQDLQMLMDFNSPNILTNEFLEGEYLYEFYPVYVRQKDGSWGEWLTESDLGETIGFKYNLAEDTYFFDSNLAAWQIWYCLDNDTSRFAWALEDAAIKVYDAEDDSSLIYKRHKSHDTNLFAWVKVINSDDVEFKGVYDWDNLDDSDLIFTESENIALGSTLIRQGDISVEVVDRQYDKGVIYRMIDEWNNDCPYDFKNIMFKRRVSLDEGHPVIYPDVDKIWVYTFAGNTYHIEFDEWSDMLADGSLESPYRYRSDNTMHSTFHNNVIKPYIRIWNEENPDSAEIGVRYLNDIVFFGYWEASEDAEALLAAFCCHNISLGNDCHNISFGVNCRYITFGAFCYNVSFYYDCLHCTLMDNVHDLDSEAEYYIVFGVNGNGDVVGGNIADLF